MYANTVAGIQKRFRDSGLHTPDEETCLQLIEIKAEMERLKGRPIDVVGPTIQQIRLAAGKARRRRNRLKNKKPR